MKRGACLLAAAAAIASPATARVVQFAHWDRVPARHAVLITPNGQPVGGQWQQWIDQSHAPTINENITIDMGAVARECNADAGACSSANTIYLGHDATRGMLYHELGHIFDANALTDAQRLQFMRIWKWTVLPGETIQDAWWRGESNADPVYGHGPPAEWFAEGYRLCATYAQWTWNDAAYNATWVQYGYPAQLTGQAGVPIPRQRWALGAQRATCRLITRS